MATNRDLGAGSEQRLVETQNRRVHLERVFNQQSVEFSETNCPSIDGIAKTVKATASDIDEKQVWDAALTFGAQMVGR